MYEIVSQGKIEGRIFVIRGRRIMLDRDLAELYGVETKYLNRQVRRNKERFPDEFMFQITQKEKNELVTNWHQNYKRGKLWKVEVVWPFIMQRAANWSWQ